MSVLSTPTHLAVALAEMHVAHAQVCALHKHGKVDAAAAGEILDVAVAAILTAGNCTRCALGDALPIRVVGGDLAQQSTLGLRKQCCVGNGRATLRCPNTLGVACTRAATNCLPQ
jgi:hypothetical protein